MRLSLEVIDTKFNGVVLYVGPSLLNGKPIVVIATGLRTRSKNGKTGEFIQTYILSAEGERPTDALDSGADESVCGDCINRKVDGWGTCYVNVGQGPNAIYAAWKRGAYPAFKAEHLDEYFKDRIIRLGAYGDPSACPVEVWEKVCSVASGWTGYTHQWRKKEVQGLNRFCMASVETARQMRRAKRMGWKTFRVRIEGEAIEKGEFVCPASEEAGKRKTCETCLACHGGEFNGKQVTPVIMVHGMGWKVRRFTAMRKRMDAKKTYRTLDKRLIGLGASKGLGTGVLSS